MGWVFERCLFALGVRYVDVLVFFVIVAWGFGLWVGGGGGDIRLVGRYFWIQDCCCIVLFRCGSWDLVVEYVPYLTYVT